MNFFKKKEKSEAELTQKLGYNPVLLNQIQPQGGITFKDDKFISSGDGYLACVHIYGYPKHIDTHWLAKITNNNGIFAMIDISTEDINEVKRNINKSMKEQQFRYSSSTNGSEVMDAQQRYQELQYLYDEISQLGEVVKLIHIRLYTSAKTKDECDKNAKALMNNLEANGYKSTICLNESKNEWKSIFQTYTEQAKEPYSRYGQPILSDSLAAGYPFHFTSLDDKYGTYLGTTTSSVGSVLFDMFAVTKTRLSYNGLCIGNMGAGKSTTLKKLMLDMATRGNYIRGFDVTGEFTELVNHLGGKMIALDGSCGILNALEILKTSDDENICFSRHISKLNTIYKFLVPNVDIYDVIEFEQIIRQLYSERGISTDGFSNKQITGLPPARYPIFSDLLALIKRIKNELDENQHDVAIKERILRIARIELVIDNLISNYGHIFNGHTSIENIFDTQIVFFNIKNLSQMKPEIFDAQIFNALSLCWDNCIKIGTPMKELYDTKQIAWEDITRFMIFIDEAHKIINTNKLTAVEQLVIFEREARKYFGGLLYASQSIRDFVPENSEQEAVEKIKTLFELTQYKFIMQQDANTLDILNRVFQYQLTQSELNRIPKLGKGQCILAISSDRNIEFEIEITNEEKALFQGGA